MIIKKVTEIEINEIIDSSYNPPTYTQDFTKDNFHDEYWHIHEKFSNILNDFGSNSAYNDEGNYFLGEDYSNSRWISVQLDIDAKNIFNSSLILKTYTFLNQLSVDYAVCITLDAGDKLYDLIITKESIKIEYPDNFIKKLGLIKYGVKNIDYKFKNEEYNRIIGLT